MELSPTATRALEQVKMGLYMLRGADYFTDDEWIKIDGLIHKGQYVFTSGPKINHTNVFEGELINFDDTVESDVEVRPKAFDPIKEETVQVSEKELPSPTSDPAEISDFPAETPNTTSAETSSDDEPSLPTSAETSDYDKPEPAARQASVQLPKNGGLALGYSQAMLDEIKAFNSTLTKAGQKSKPGKSNRSVVESYNSYDAEEPQSYPSDSLAEQDAHNQIQTWASDVQDNASTPTPIQSPAPTKAWNSTPATITKTLIETFKETHGRSPKSTNDLIQPNNPNFKPLTARPYSRVSHTSAKSSTAASSILSTQSRGPGQGKLNVKPGTILIAQRDYARKSAIQLDIKRGDQISYMKHVSGVTHVGENQRTKLKGQFFEDVLKKDDSPQTLIQQQRAAALQASGHPGVIGSGRLMKGTSVNTDSTGLERIERINAAEWDDGASVTTTNTTTSMIVRARPTVPVAKPVGGLGSSRFASEDKKSSPSQGISKEELGHLIDQKFAQILAAQAAREQSPTIPNGPTRPPFRPWTKPPITDPLKKVQPKTATCWWWATPNKECRFTADECRDLHGYLPSTGADPPNLRMGKPTWGALADSLPDISSTPTLNETVQENAAPGPANVGAHRSLTCWYWANDPKGCSNSAVECKYLHEKCANGVANKPSSWKKINWSRFTDGEGDGGRAWAVNDDAETDANGETSASYGWGESSVSGWGEESNVYKPPHIKALEERALAEAVGW